MTVLASLFKMAILKRNLKLTVKAYPRISKIDSNPLILTKVYLCIAKLTIFIFAVFYWL